MLDVKKSILESSSTAIDDSNVLYFDSDDEFYTFAVIPEFVIEEDPAYTPDGNISQYYTTFKLSNAYNKALKDNKIFVIKDENSQIYKHKAVSFRGMTQPIDNLAQYFEYTDFD